MRIQLGGSCSWRVHSQSEGTLMYQKLTVWYITVVVTARVVGRNRYTAAELSPFFRNILSQCTIFIPGTASSAMHFHALYATSTFNYEKLNFLSPYRVPQYSISILCCTMILFVQQRATQNNVHSIATHDITLVCLQTWLKSLPAQCRKTVIALYTVTSSTPVKIQSKITVEC
jgi:hypothetical protein